MVTETVLKSDKEVDTVVVGYGLAGAIAAISAHDTGAEVLILEKAKHAGGCSILSGGVILIVRNVEKAVQYFTELSVGTVTPDIIRAFAEGLAQNLEFISQLAKVDGAQVQEASWKGIYPLAGREQAFGRVVVTKIPRFTGFDQVTSSLTAIPGLPGGAGLPEIASAQKNGQLMFRMVMDNVESRKIPVFVSTRAKELIMDSNGIVRGVRAESEGEERVLKARRGVILACGGFEQNEWMRSQYLQGKPFYSMAPLSATGDGIVMAQKAGAALWHLWHVHGSYGFKFPEYPIAIRMFFGGPRNPNARMPWIVVDKYFKRYMNEYPPAPQDSAHRPMELWDADLAEFTRIPSYLIFDEAGRKLGPIAQPMGFRDELSYDWSRDNLKEVERGWIVKADSIRELAEKLKRLHEAKGEVDVAALEETVFKWNKCNETGKDPLFRPAGTMMPISTPPFYGVLVWPVISNTQGGPVHNAKQQVVDAFGKVIPRLYAAGELGSFFSQTYELSGNLGECVSSGCIAGRNAAGEPTLAAEMPKK